MRIVACGDVVLNEKVIELFRENHAGDVGSAIRSIFSTADLRLANIECPITTAEQPFFPIPPALKASPELAAALELLNLNVGSLANNHIADFGQQGLRDTMTVLDDLGIQWTGAGWSRQEANSPLIVSKRGEKIGIVSLAQQERSAVSLLGWGAGVLDEEEALATVKRLKNDGVNHVICYFHYGVEFMEYPTPDQVSLSRCLIDEGAAMVLGHHPHVSQGFEKYKNGFIAYSLGNYIFDMEPGEHRFSRLGLVVDAELDAHGVKDLSVIPFNTQGGVPCLLVGNDKTAAVKYLSGLNEGISNSILLEKNYYFTCRDSLYILLHAMWLFAIKKRSWLRLKTILKQQLWPQILLLRKDLLRFIRNGQAVRFEKEKTVNNSASKKVYVCLCQIVYFLGCGWIGILNTCKNNESSLKNHKR